MIVDDILKLKKSKNAIVLAHCYQNVEIDEVADYIGDSLYLSQMAAKTHADIIVFAGVFFMAQTAKIISPNKKVLLPNMQSGCLMADMVDLKQLEEFKSKHKDVPTVCYINSTAEIKAACDICCTSSNALKIVKSLGVKEVLFLPDTYLGKWVESQLENVNVITYPGFCPTHMRILPEYINELKEKYPKSLVLAHPECHKEVCKMADYVGSTSGIMKFAENSDNKTFIIATEKGVVDRLKRDFPQKEFIMVRENIICQNMKHNTLEDILRVLETEENEIQVKSEISQKALKSINRMLEVCK